MVLPVVRADFSVVETYVYVPEPPLAVPAFTFGGLNDAMLSRRRSQAWCEQTQATFSLCMLHGGHFFIHTAREAFLRNLGTELEFLVATLPTDEGEERPWSAEPQDR